MSIKGKAYIAGIYEHPTRLAKDLSLAQIAALGATVAMLLPFSGGDPHAPGVYWFSLGFTFIGAAVFSRRLTINWSSDC